MCGHVWDASVAGHRLVHFKHACANGLSLVGCSGKINTTQEGNGLQYSEFETCYNRLTRTAASVSYTHLTLPTNREV